MMDPMMPKKRAMDNLSMGAFKPTMDEFALANLSDASWCNGFYFPKNIGRYFYKYVSFSDGGYSERERYKRSHLWFAKKMQLRHPGKRLIIKSAATSSRIKELLEIFPDARFMHIYRNPYETYRSTERLYEKILPLFGFHKVSNQFMEQYIIDSYRDFHLKWFAEKHLIPKDRLVEFSFEDFTSEPLTHLTNAYEALKIDLTKGAINAFKEVASNHSAYQQNKYTDIPVEIKRKVREHWEFCFNNWGYPI